jgi:hypothetical protein
MQAFLQEVQFLVLHPLLLYLAKYWMFKKNSWGYECATRLNSFARLQDVVSTKVSLLFCYIKSYSYLLLL